MTKLLKIALGAAVISCVGAGAAFAGANSSATAALYWQTGTNLGSTARDNAGATAKFVVTIKGLASFRGCDVELFVNSLDGGPLPDAWNGSGGGCMNTDGDVTGGNFLMARGGSGAYGNAFSPAAPSETAVTNVVEGQKGEFVDTGDCKTPHGVGLIWLSASGAAGAARTAAREYALMNCTFNESGAGPDGPCAGDLTDGPRGVCINPNNRIPCNVSGAEKGAVVQIFDLANARDYCGFAAGKVFLTWSGGSAVGACPGVTAAKTTTWGTVKKLYR